MSETKTDEAKRFQRIIIEGTPEDIRVRTDTLVSNLFLARALSTLIATVVETENLTRREGGAGG